jgi:hypothetical protein
MIAVLVPAMAHVFGSYARGEAVNRRLPLPAAIRRRFTDEFAKVKIAAVSANHNTTAEIGLRKPKNAHWWGGSEQTS